MRYYLSCLVLSFSFLFSFGQVGDPRSQLSVGVNGGLAFNTVSFDPTVKQKQHQGISFGVTVRYTCEKYFSTVCAIQAELDYTQLGWKEDVYGSNGQPLSDTYQRDLGYVQLPLLARLAWGKEKKGLMFFILLGPQLGYYLKGSEKKSGQWTLNDEGNPDRPNNVYQQYGLSPQKSLDYGLTGGLGVEFNTKNGQHFMIDGRYYYGLSDIYDNGKKDPFARSAHTTISARLTYLFDLFNR